MLGIIVKASVAFFFFHRAVATSCCISCEDCNGTCCNVTICNGDCDSYYAGIGIAVGVAAIFCLILGAILGVAVTVGFYKLLKWMEGKTVVFSPWPRIHSSMEESALQNPTYEMDRAIGKKCTPSAKNNVQEVYEVVNEEPINEKEVDLEPPASGLGLLPYAIHDFSEDCSTGETMMGSVGVAKNKSGRTVASKTNPNRPRKPKKDLDIRRSMSESGKLDIERQKQLPKPQKPPKAQRIKKPLAKPSLPTVTASLEVCGYSELNQKTSYATLEPHMGGEESSVVVEPNEEEKYCHLNH